MSRQVLVIGDVMTDVIVMPEGPLVKGSDRRAKVRSRPGGSGANQAVWLGAMGAEVALVARVGTEELHMYENYFRGLGVVPFLGGDKELPSGVLVTIVDPDGERSFLTDRGANLHLSAADLPKSLLDNLGMVVVSGYSLFAPEPRAAVRDFLSLAKASGVAVAVDPASEGFLREVGPDKFVEWTAGADWIFANQDEAETLCGAIELDVQMRLLGSHFANVVIKRGRFGAALGGLHGIKLTMEAPVVTVVDSTGAGDAFAAGFLAAHVDGASPEVALARAIEAGAKAVRSIGGQPPSMG
ncbi:MAG: sugar kinase [Devosia sp.]|uniref:carbohydrate kinase family protein n=1 Tax=Devosia sp. TaxID=1871048 RepID=UPI0026255588|nr:sugar kinase [Devosia sp.]MDB5529335.1 sugar kinase [Devosia sp.]